MNKIAHYLNDHILGEVDVRAVAREHFATDASPLRIVPEMIVHPYVTNDIRKTLRFCWQLAEKGHSLSVTARGYGSDQTGAAIGNGIIISTIAHMDKVCELDIKQRLVRVQPGVTFSYLNQVLATYGLTIPVEIASRKYATVGGMVANNASGRTSYKHGDIGRWVRQVEVVLSNGDVIQTGRISKRDVNRKKGQQTLEGEIYRQVDGLIGDYASAIDQYLDTGVRDNSGYGHIADVRRKDGSVDLTPLFLASQGTLGVISEMILNVDYLSVQQSAMLLALASYDDARDAVDELAKLTPSQLEVIDADLFDAAERAGRSVDFYTNATKDATVGAVIVVVFDEMSNRIRAKKIKKALKKLSPNIISSSTAEGDAAEELIRVRDITATTMAPIAAGDALPPVLDGFYVPLSRFEDFSRASAELAAKHHMTLPIYGHALEGVFYIRPLLQLKKVTARQALLTLLHQYAELIDKHGGHIVAESAEGRLKSADAYTYINSDILQLYQTIKATFDPYSILNPGVKQAIDKKQLMGLLDADYSPAKLSSYAPHN